MKYSTVEHPMEAGQNRKEDFKKQVFHSLLKQRVNLLQAADCFSLRQLQNCYY